MATDIKCPKCGEAFALGEAEAEEYKKELQQKMTAYVRQKDEEFKRKADDFEKREREMLEQSLRKSIAIDFENQVRLLEQNNKNNEERLKQAREKEMEFLQRLQELKNKEAELELSVQRKMLEERSKLSEDIRKQEEQKNQTKETEYQLKVKELEKQLNDQRVLADEMRRKAEQGSMQLQGEVQELMLEEILKTTFLFDIISEVGKGVRGADCILTIRNNVGQECGKIIFESKRTKNFDKGWVEKLKADMRSTNADIGVIVTQSMPDHLERFGQMEGIWICTFSEVSALVHVLRDGILKVFSTLRSQENKGDKMHMLYDYLTSNEFGEQWKAIREGFQSMKQSIQRERDAMEKMWKAREKQLEKVLLNAAHIKGSVEGIAGQDSINLNLIEGGDDELL
jgi:hypothetical protein